MDILIIIPSHFIRNQTIKTKYVGVAPSVSLIAASFDTLKYRAIGIIKKEYCVFETSFLHQLCVLSDVRVPANDELVRFLSGVHYGSIFGFCL
jgi:hypothetical protein